MAYIDYMALLNDNAWTFGVGEVYGFRFTIQNAVAGEDWDDIVMRADMHVCIQLPLLHGLFLFSKQQIQCTACRQDGVNI